MSAFINLSDVFTNEKATELHNIEVGSTYKIKNNKGLMAFFGFPPIIEEVIVTKIEDKVYTTTKEGNILVFSINTFLSLFYKQTLQEDEYTNILQTLHNFIYNNSYFNYLIVESKDKIKKTILISKLDVLNLKETKITFVGASSSYLNSLNDEVENCYSLTTFINNSDLLYSTVVLVIDGADILSKPQLNSLFENLKSYNKRKGKDMKVIFVYEKFDDYFEYPYIKFEYPYIKLKL